jgi:hypothetical protein
MSNIGSLIYTQLLYFEEGIGIHEHFQEQKHIPIFRVGFKPTVTALKSSYREKTYISKCKSFTEKIGSQFGVYTTKYIILYANKISTSISTGCAEKKSHLSVISNV